MEKQPILQPEDATVAVITALPIEQVATEAALGCQKATMRDPRAAFPVAVGRIQGSTGEPHIVAVTLLSGMGTTPAATRCSDLIHVCPRLRYVIMVGIAGAVPNPSKSDEHVRLGDIVVSGEAGVTQFDFGKLEGDEFNCRSTAKAPGMHLLGAVRELQVRDLQNQRPWESLIAGLIRDTLNDGTWARPPDSADVLHDEGTPVPVEHPVTAGRRAGQPKVFVGAIGTSNGVIKNAERREALRKKHGFRAIEMEGAGVAEVCHSKSRQYLVIRGTCDYCNGGKNDVWQPYAALIAAAFCRSVLEALPGASDGPAPLPVLNPHLQQAIAGLATGDQRTVAGTPLQTTTRNERRDSALPNQAAASVQLAAPPTIPVPSEIPSEPISDPKAAPQVSGVAPPAPSREAIEREGKRYLEALNAMRTNLEVDTGSRMAEVEVLPWCSRHKSELDPSLLHSIIEEIVLLETIRAMDAAGPKGKPDLTRAKAILARLRQ